MGIFDRFRRVGRLAAEAAEKVEPTPLSEGAMRVAADLKKDAADLNRLRHGGRLGTQASEDAANHLRNVREHAAKPEYQELSVAKNGKELSPVGTLNALKKGERVTDSSIDRLDDYMAKRHITQPRDAGFVGAAGHMATKGVQAILSPVVKPVSFLNRIADAHSPVTLPVGLGNFAAASLLSLGIYSYGDATFDHLDHPTLGLGLGNWAPYTALTELAEVGQQTGVNALSGRAEWEVLVANKKGNEWYGQLLKDAALYKGNPEKFDLQGKNVSATEQAAHRAALDKKFSGITDFQIEAGNYLRGLNVETQGITAKLSSAKQAEIEAGVSQGAVATVTDPQGAMNLFGMGGATAAATATAEKEPVGVENLTSYFGTLVKTHLPTTKDADLKSYTRTFGEIARGLDSNKDGAVSSAEQKALFDSRNFISLMDSMKGGDEQKAKILTGMYPSPAP